MSIYFVAAALVLMFDAGMTITSERQYRPIASLLISLLWPITVVIMFVAAIYFSHDNEARREFLERK